MKSGTGMACETVLYDGKIVVYTCEIMYNCVSL